MFFFFFFSSRRRHTRWPRDWSSDVCSSDLGLATLRVTRCQASGRAMSDQKVVHRDLAARDAQSGKATGKKMAQDDWHQQRVAVGDVNGDGKADVTASSSAQGSGQNAAVNTSHSNIKNSREIMTGQASGKRQHQPMTVSKEVDKASPKN